jgi:hypothetical protein
MDLRLRALRREVMAPRRPSSSLGLIAVSTLAMVFAVSSSLLLFSAHRHHVRRHQPAYLHNHARPPAVRVPGPPAIPAGPQRQGRVMHPPPPPPPGDECRGPIYRSRADGHDEVRFEQCPARPFASPPPTE